MAAALFALLFSVQERPTLGRIRPNVDVNARVRCRTDSVLNSAARNSLSMEYEQSDRVDNMEY